LYSVETPTGKCVAHGAHKEFVGMTIGQIFDLVHISYADADALHERFMAADRSWVSYLWSDDGREVCGKLASIVNNITDVSNGNSYYIGVGVGTIFCRWTCPAPTSRTGGAV